MFESDVLKAHLESSQTVSGESLIIAEWNMNDPENVERLDNYHHNHALQFNPTTLTSSYDPNNTNLEYGATDADVEIAGPYDENEDPTIIIENKLKWKLLYSLDDCIKPHRPRSGINHSVYIQGKYLQTDVYDSNRPRYYMGAYENTFRYWTSLRHCAPNDPRYAGTAAQESETVVGISGGLVGTARHLIKDACPFVVYNENVATNKIVVKMQTNVGTVDRGSFRNRHGETISDPFYGDENATVPNVWRIEVLKGFTWETVQEFNENSKRSDDTAIVGPDGYVELQYGIVFPNSYDSLQKQYMGTNISETNLPNSAVAGQYYLIVPNEGDRGTVHIWNEGAWESFVPTYGWYLKEDYDLPDQTVSSLTTPLTFEEASETFYREMEYIRGIRIVVTSMNVEDCTFDLIEMSPRLCFDVSHMVKSYKATKSVGSIDSTGVPVGSLSAGVGDIQLFDYEDAFREGSGSLISNALDFDVSFHFWEVIKSVNGYDYFVPVKKMYTENKRPKYGKSAEVSYELRDLFYFFESVKAPQLLMTNVSLSAAITTLLDNVGFSNYTFKRIDGQTEPQIPFFFVAPDQNIVQVLQKLSAATQTAMYFDEYNNFTVMYKEYLMPEEGDRDVDLVLDGDSDAPNIKEINSTDKKAMNKGVIKYTERYIQRSTGSLAQQSFQNSEQSWIYTPALLWEVAGDDATRTINEGVAKQASYALGAMPLNSDLSAAVPRVKAGEIINNILDLGDGVYWLPRFEGYLYAAGEIIKFDAVQYSVQGTGVVWIKNNDDYQRYFATLPFNGKMYPTGLVRIFCEPFTRVVDGATVYANGDAKKHGRGQFGTDIVAHSAGLDDRWSSGDYTNALEMESQYLFDGTATPDTEVGAVTSQTGAASSSKRTGKIINFMRNIPYGEYESNPQLNNQYMIQSSALVFEGVPNAPLGFERDYVTYTYKRLDSGTGGKFKHFGTRMRIIGQLEAAADALQQPAGAYQSYASVIDGELKVLTGGSGGIAVGLNTTTHNGYYFELVALTNTNLDTTVAEDGLQPHNIVFYKIEKSTAGGTNPGIPVKLWGKLTDVIVDDGTFVGESRQFGEEVTSVYDLNVEYKNIGSTRRFFLYLNGTQVAVVDDPDPLPEYNGTALFVRGESKCMFENFYALSNNIAFDSSTEIVARGTVSDAFDVDYLEAESLRKYSLSSLLRKSYLAGVNPVGDDEFKIWYEEFGTIMRECAYFDIRYDRAFPALAAQVSPIFNGVPGYTVAHFTAGSYGAKFLVFNATDKALNMGGDSANFLRIQGVTFTQNTSREYTLDDYYKDREDLTGTAFNYNNDGLNYNEIVDRYKNIKINRMKYGDSEFTVESDYIQTQGAADNLMGWLADRCTRTRQQVGISLFMQPMLQLGDIVTISYSGDNGDFICADDTKFVVYNIEFQKNAQGPTTTVYLSEV